MGAAARNVVHPGQPMEHPHIMIALKMMATFDGKERTE
jgi:hypothetical protein